MDAASAPRLLHEIFAATAQQHASRIAVDVTPGIGRPLRQTRTYQELQRDAAAVASALLAARGERTVAILLSRDTPWLYAAQLGVLQSGACYVGLESRFPDEHIRFVLEDCAAEAVVTDAQGIGRLRPLVGDSVQLLDIATLREAPSTAAAAPSQPISPHRLAYLIYTSGTTGKPKGVMIEHRSVVNLVLSDVGEFQLGPSDRIAQGSSPAYDSSVEETWLAFAVGATVVPMDDEVVRRGPDLLPWLRTERITVLCPPPTLLRATGCKDPLAALPELRLLYVGGEALPQELADLWATGRRMVNGYGPTECTVTVTRAEVRPGQPVTIGDAVPGSRAHVLDEDLNDVAFGEWGELCISGASLARGYLGREELTNEKFVQHALHGRIYRTGDRVRCAADGALVYDGRLDAQVKLRGHRVELGEIESRIAAMDGVRAAACTVQAGETLVAFVVAAANGAQPDFDRIRAQLRRDVPSHMVPEVFASIAQLPTSVGGKLDRRALPKVDVSASAPLQGRDPRGELELLVAGAWQKALGRPRVPADVDFFEIGGNSLRAAVAISLLRDDARTDGLAVRDLYEARTVEALAARAENASAGLPPEREMPVLQGRRPLLCTAVQTAWLLGEVVCAAAMGYAAVFLAAPWLIEQLGPWTFALSVVPIAAAAQLLWLLPSLAFAVVAKKILVGRYVAGRHPVYGMWYLRHWIVLRCARHVPWNAIHGTGLQIWALRCLGARIGRRVHLHRGVDFLSGGWDLIDIGDDASLGQESSLGMCEYDDGCVVLAPVRMGNGSTLEVRASLDGNASLGDGSCITALSIVTEGCHVPAGERWEGVPAKKVGLVAPPPEITCGGERMSPFAYSATSLALRFVAAWAGLLPLLFTTGALLHLAGDVEGLQAWLEDPTVGAGSFGLFALTIALAIVVSLTLQALVMRVMPKVPAGVMRTHSALHLLTQMRTHSVDLAGFWLAGTLFWPMWLRLAGARIGEKAEISTILDVLPEHVQIGNRCFLADGIYLGGPRIDRGTVEARPFRLGDGTFLGNHVVVPQGVQMDGGILLGVATVADPVRMTKGTSWFGHPSFQLPQREVIKADDSVTMTPRVVRVANRVFWEALRFSVPLAPAVAFVWWAEQLAPWSASDPMLWLWAAPLASLGFAWGLAVLVIAIKWALLGQMRPGTHALWSCWCSRWDFVYVAWEFLTRQALTRLSGTLWMAWYLRAMGVKVGKRVVLGNGFAQVVDPDMLAIGDDATVDTMFQAHSFEDRVLKLDHVKVGPRVTLRRGSVILYGATFGEGCILEGHSVVMKNEKLLPRRMYVGAPSQPAR